MMLALCLLLATTTTTEPAPAPWPLPSRLEPLAGSEFDVSLQLGVAAQRNSFEGTPVRTLGPGGGLQLRWGVTDNVELALPLLVTGSVRLFDDEVRPFATIGLTGIGYSNAQGIVGSGIARVGARFGDGPVAFSVDATAIAERGFGALPAEGEGEGEGEFFDDAVDFGGSVGVGVGVAVNDAVSVGGTARVAAVGDRVRVQIGGFDSTPCSPALRWHALSWLSVDLWPFTIVSVTGGDVANRSVVVGALAGVTVATWPEPRARRGP